MAIEADLRRWLKAVWGPGLNWVEQASGGTVGFPDVVLNLPSGQLPVELKMWRETKRGIACKVRPAQIRYHRLTAQDGGKSALLVGVDGIDKQQYEIFVLPGWAVPHSTYPGVKFELMASKHLIAWSRDKNPGAKARLIKKLESEDFWSRESIL